jgi:hypothetical protein
MTTPVPPAAWSASPDTDRALGGEPRGPADVDRREMMFAMFRDPAGNVIGLLKTA